MSSLRYTHSSIGADGKFLVAIDLGTTYSGIAWAHTMRPETQHIVDRWPGVAGMTIAKVPTEICYDQDGIKWGFQIPDSQNRYQCFKLGLEPSIAKNRSHLGLLFPDPKALSVNHKTTSEVLISDYLTCLREHISDILKDHQCDNVLETTAIEYVITVPAIWSEAAQQRTRSCAERAGITGDVRLVLEPEAAILHAVDQELSELAVGEIVVVCDAGGGTVDLISYIIDQLKPVLEISEVAPGTGSACGSNLLNRMFRQMLQNRFIHLPDWADDTLQGASDDFENTVKRTFDNSDKSWLISVPGLLDNHEAGIRRGKLHMGSSEIRALFDPVIAIITSLVQMQIKISEKKGNVKIVYLVGGFGGSPYLRNSLKTVVPESIQVISPANAWTAVVRGALIKGLAETSPLAAAVKVGSRAARRAYGVRIRTPFRAGVHQHDRKFFGAFEGKDVVRVMDWFVKKGHKLKEDEHSTVEYYEASAVSSGRIDEVEVMLFSFESDRDRPPPLYEEHGAKEMVKLTADLSSIPTKLLPIEKGADRKKYYCIDYQIRVNFEAARIVYSLWYKNKRYGMVNAEYL